MFWVATSPLCFSSCATEPWSDDFDPTSLMEFPHQMVEGGGTLKQTADIVFSKMRELFSVKCLSDSLLTYYTWVCVCVCVSHSVVFNSAATWTVAHQAPLSMGFSKQEYWSGLPFPPPGDLPNPGIKPRFSVLHTNSLLSEPPGKPVFDYRKLILHFLLRYCC